MIAGSTSWQASSPENFGLEACQEVLPAITAPADRLPKKTSRTQRSWTTMKLRLRSISLVCYHETIYYHPVRRAADVACALNFVGAVCTSVA